MDPKMPTELMAYLSCAIWADLRDEHGDSLDHAVDLSDIAPEAIEEARADLEAFMSEAGDLLVSLSSEQIGHNFYLTRNRHGAGFWDRGLGSVGERLTELAHPYGESCPYLGDDGKIYLS